MLATRDALTNIVRRVGVVLNAVHEVVERDLLKADRVTEATALRDELKPLIDSLIHFEWRSDATTNYAEPQHAEDTEETDVGDESL